jgi:hypothetical protein
VAEQNYNMLVTTKALRSVHTEIDDQSNTVTTTRNRGRTNDYEIIFELSGQYTLHLTENVKGKVSRSKNIYPDWKTNLNGVKTNNYKFRLHTNLAAAIINRVKDIEREHTHQLNMNSIKGYTRFLIVQQ